MNRLGNFSIRKKKNNLLKFLIGAVALLIFIFILNFFTPAIKNSFYAMSSPIQKLFWNSGESSSTFLGSLLNAGSIFKENEKLKQENQKLLYQVAFLRSIEQANKAQSDVSLSCQDSGFKLIMAGVTGLEDNDILSINKGSADGIKEGMPVINQQNVLFGKVSKVYKNFSKVMLISSKNSVINVKVQQELQDPVPPEIDGVVKGNGGLGAFLDLIPVSDNINPQDILVTSSVEKSFPKDLLVAKINKVQKDDQKPFQQAEISLFLNVKASDNLFVIANYKQAN